MEGGEIDRGEEGEEGEMVFLKQRFEDTESDIIHELYA